MRRAVVLVGVALLAAGACSSKAAAPAVTATTTTPAVTATTTTRAMVSQRDQLAGWAQANRQTILALNSDMAEIKVQTSLASIADTFGRPSVPDGLVPACTKTLGDAKAVASLASSSPDPIVGGNLAGAANSIHFDAAYCAGATPASTGVPRVTDGSITTDQAKYEAVLTQLGLG